MKTDNDTPLRESKQADRDTDRSKLIDKVKSQLTKEGEKPDKNSRAHRA